MVGLLAALALGACSPDAGRPAEGVASSDAPTTMATPTGPPSEPATATSSTVAAATEQARAGVAVRSITDGDTLVLADGRRVRLAQVDAPETGACFGSEATQALRALVEGRTVTVRPPEDGPERDRYGRTLGEVSVAGRSVNEELVRSGAAGWYREFAGEDAGLADRLRAAEDQAKTAGTGLWSACSSRRAAAAPGTAPPPTRRLQVQPGATCHPAYPGGCIPPAPPDLDCGDIRRRVQVDHSHGDPHRLDADSDGWGCDSYG